MLASTTVEGGGSADPDKNALLANTLKKAKEQGVPKENIAKSLSRVKYLAPAKSVLHLTQFYFSQCVGGERTGERFTYEALAFNSVGIIM